MPTKNRPTITVRRSAADGPTERTAEFGCFINDVGGVLSRHVSGVLTLTYYDGRLIVEVEVDGGVELRSAAGSFMIYKDANGTPYAKPTSRATDRPKIDTKDVPTARHILNVYADLVSIAKLAQNPDGGYARATFVLQDDGHIKVEATFTTDRETIERAVKNGGYRTRDIDDWRFLIDPWGKPVPPDAPSPTLRSLAAAERLAARKVVGI